MREYLLHKTDRLECAQGFVVQANSTRIIDQRFPLVDHQCPNILETEDVGQGEPDRAGTDDHHINLRCLRGVTDLVPLDRSTIDSR